MAHVKTIEDTLEEGAPQLSLIKRDRGEKYVLGYLKIWLVFLQSNLSIKRKLSEDMIDLCAEMILDEVWWITLADIKYVITEALKGKYGEFFESLTIPKIISWFMQHSERKIDICEGRGGGVYEPMGKRIREHIIQSSNLLTSGELKQIDEWTKENS